MNNQQFSEWRLQMHEMPSSVCKPLVMGILNITSDSFSDGGVYLEQHSAFSRAQEMIAEGVDIIDVGGESTKPGALPISLDEELSRVIPIIEHIRKNSDICISIDTYKPAVMKAAVSAGAGFINDIKALRSDGALSTAMELGVPVCLMHMQGDPLSMQENPTYANDVVEEINTFFIERIKACEQAQIPRHRLILDPGFGFGKLVANNLLLVKKLSEFKRHQLPLLLGASRKNTLGVVTNEPVQRRLAAGLAVSVFAALQGVSMIRTHDVAETNQALKMVDAIMKAEQYEGVA